MNVILISSPRSGTEWFIDGLHDIKYSGQELFTIQGPTADNYKRISLKTRLQMLRSCPANRCEKFFVFDIFKIFRIHEYEGQELMKILMNRKDLYWLERRDIRAQIISFFVAQINWNFHYNNDDLTKSDYVTFNDVLGFYTGLVDDGESLKGKLPFVEKFVFEDLLSGETVPKTLNWSPQKSRFKKRDSTKYEHLIKNIDEVHGWITDLMNPQSQIEKIY